MESKIDPSSLQAENESKDWNRMRETLQLQRDSVGRVDFNENWILVYKFAMRYFNPPVCKLNMILRKGLGREDA